MNKFKLVPIEPTREMWAAAGDAVVALNSQHHDAISGAVYNAMLVAAPEVVMVGFCEDTALSLAERTFSTEVDEQLAEDIIQYARRLHSMYTAPDALPSTKCQGAGCTDQGCPAHYANDYQPIP